MNIPQAAECFSLLVTFDSGSRARDEKEEPQWFKSSARHVFFQGGVLHSSPFARNTQQFDIKP